MAHVFISYAHKDYDELVKLFIKRLKEAGFDEWIDREQLRGTDNWPQKINSEIDSSYAFIVIETSNSARSLHVRHECSFAMGRDVPIFPILCKKHKNMNVYLPAIQRFDFTDTTWPEWDAFIARLGEVKDEFGTVVRIPQMVPSKLRQAMLLLNGVNPDSKVSGIQLLADSFDPIVIPALIQVLQDNTVDRGGEAVGDRATRGLMKMNNKEATPLLLDMLHHDDPNVRHRVVRVLVTLEDKRAVPKLLDMISDSDIIVRREVIFCLGVLQEAIAIQHLLKTLEHDDDFGSRMQAAIALGKFQSLESILGLKKALNDENKAVCEMSLNALELIGTSEALATVETWKQENKPT